MAALPICEALLLTMNDRDRLPEDEIMTVFRDAAATQGTATGPDAGTHRALAALIDRIIAGVNSVRRP